MRFNRYGWGVAFVTALIAHPLYAQPRASTTIEAGVLPPGFSRVEGSTLPLVDVVWGLFVTTTATDELGLEDGRAVLRGMGLDASSAEILFRHMRSAVDQKKQSDLARQASLCGKRSSIVTAEDLVRELDDIRRDVEMEKQQFVDRLSRILDPKAHATLLEVAEEQRSSMDKVEIDPAAALAASPPSAVSEALARGCSQALSSAPRGRERILP